MKLYHIHRLYRIHILRCSLFLFEIVQFCVFQPKNCQETYRRKVTDVAAVSSTRNDEWFLRENTLVLHPGVLPLPGGPSWFTATSTFHPWERGDGKGCLHLRSRRDHFYFDLISKILVMWPAARRAKRSLSWKLCYWERREKWMLGKEQQSVTNG